MALFRSDLRNTKADIRSGGNRAFYSPAMDYIQLPPFPAFRNAESFYATLAHEAWRKLSAPGVDATVCAILRAILPAAIAMRVEELAAAKKLVELDLGAKQPEGSTASVVRSFAWAAQLLGVGRVPGREKRLRVPHQLPDAHPARQIMLLGDVADPA